MTGFSITQSERFSGAGKAGGQHWQVRQAHVLITQELTGYSEACLDLNHLQISPNRHTSRQSG